METASCPWWKRTMKAIRHYLHTMAGVPSYERYLEHFHKHHPGETPLSEKEFHKKATDEKYGGGTIRRCC
ncbi:hypothetical protein GCM10011571_30860 [Marinithermofilum abyssi]|uniref:YbdD/YjiX family protein n=1 Tax=Marinithermofilum abyssi TaxID=1571185 RepID=A0A8J2VJ46_9BACL|nr:hypothetical protein GCM10011571_30860 [Marinithermofilum abyssi]